MNNDVINILDEIVSEHGIEIIKKYIKSYNTKARKTHKKGNKKDAVAIEVYRLVISNEYDLANALIEISIKRDISDSTVKNHKNTFYQQAKKDYLEAYRDFCYDNPIGNFEAVKYESNYEEYYSMYEVFRHYPQEKLEIYDYLFTQVFPTKKDIKKKEQGIMEEELRKKLPFDIDKDPIPF